MPLRSLLSLPSTFSSVVLAGVALAIAVLAVSCGEDGDPPPVDEGRRPEVLAAIGQNVFWPTIQSLETEAAALQTAAEAYAAAPSEETRVPVQMAWRETMAVVEQLEMMQIGPAAALDAMAMGAEDLRAQIYAWPLVNTCAIDQRVAGENPGDAETLADEPVNRRGLLAVEYLVFRDDPSNTCSPLSPLNSEGTWDALSAEELAQRRASVVAAAATDVARRASNLVERWDPAAGAFLTELTDPTRSGALYESAQEGLNAVSDALFYLDRQTKDGKVGEPAGVTMCDANTCPESRESRWADASKEHGIANLRAFQRVYLGGAPDETEALGFDDLLRDMGAGTFADEMASHIADAIAAGMAIEGTLVGGLESDLEAVVAWHTAIRLVTTDLKTMFVAVLDLRVPSSAAGDND